MKTKFLIFLLRCCSLLSLATLSKLGTMMGSCLSLFPTRMVKTTRRNLELCFPELSSKEQQVLAKQSIQATCITMLEMGPMWFWPVNKLLGSVQGVEGLSLLQEAYQENKGLIVVGPHLGNWEIVSPYLNACGCGQFTAMYQAPKEAALDRIVYSARSRSGVALAATESKGVGKILKVLRDGGMVGVLPDQVPPKSGGQFSPFFGIDALTMTLLARLLKKTDARIVLAYAKRVTSAEGQGFNLIIRPMDSMIYAEHIPDSLLAMNRSIELAVRECLAQYQWEYKRFKRQPEGRPPIY